MAKTVNQTVSASLICVSFQTKHVEVLNIMIMVSKKVGNSFIFMVNAIVVFTKCVQRKTTIPDLELKYDVFQMLYVFL